MSFLHTFVLLENVVLLNPPQFLHPAVSGKAKKRKQLMDTDDLSRETYRAIITEAEKFNSDLTLQFGLLSDNCKDEQEFIDKSTQLINELKIADSGDLKDIFFWKRPQFDQTKKTLDKILDNIAKVKQIPIAKRHFDF
jgi:hypothetical protein